MKSVPYRLSACELLKTSSWKRHDILHIRQCLDDDIPFVISNYHQLRCYLKICRTWPLEGDSTWPSIVICNNYIAHSRGGMTCVTKMLTQLSFFIPRATTVLFSFIIYCLRSPQAPKSSRSFGIKERGEIEIVILRILRLQKGIGMASILMSVACCNMGK